MLARFFIRSAVTAIFILIAISAGAATRAILIPGKTAILLMEGVSSAGIDPEPRALYDSIAMAPIQQSGGDAKLISTVAKDFNLTCTTRNTTKESVICNIVVKPSSGSVIAAGKAEYHLQGAEAAGFFEKLTGAGATQSYLFETANGQMRIEATRETFDFYFHQ